MSDLQALPPANSQFNFGKIRKEQESVYEKLQREDEAFWTNLKLHGVYPRLKKYILDLCDGLDQLEEGALINGASVEEIGIRRVINKLTKANLMSLITKVERTSEVINARKQGGAEKRG